MAFFSGTTQTLLGEQLTVTDEVLTVVPGLSFAPGAPVSGNVIFHVWGSVIFEVNGGSGLQVSCDAASVSADPISMTYTLFDSSGNLVDSFATYFAAYTFADPVLPDGTYFLRIEGACDETPFSIYTARAAATGSVTARANSTISIITI